MEQETRRMKARDKVILWFCLLAGLAGAGFMLYLQYLLKTGRI